MPFMFVNPIKFSVQNFDTPFYNSNDCTARTRAGCVCNQIHTILNVITYRIDLTMWCLDCSAVGY